MNKYFVFFPNILSVFRKRSLNNIQNKNTIGGRKKEIYSKVVNRISGERFSNPGISEFAIISERAVISETATISPGVYIGDNVKIGERTRIYPNATILDDTVVGSDVIIGSGSVIGGEGYGYYQEAKSDRIKHVPQIGKVYIEDDVHIGSNVSVDRAAVGNTKIGKGTKINNNVHIAHNVQIGSNCLIMAGVSISGSTNIGDAVVLNPHAAVSKKVRIGNNAVVGMNSTVIDEIPPDARVYGTPARAKDTRS